MKHTITTYISSLCALMNAWQHDQPNILGTSVAAAACPPRKPKNGDAFKQLLV